jgi:predicted DNA-binding transcriptional regulator AlpA
VETPSLSLAVLLEKFSGLLENMGTGNSLFTVSGKKDIPKLVLREDEAEVALSLSAGSLDNRWNAESASYDPSFPAPIVLGEGGERRTAIGWRTAELVHWVNTRPRAVKKRQVNKGRQPLKSPQKPASTELIWRL